MIKKFALIIVVILLFSSCNQENTIEESNLSYPVISTDPSISSYPEPNNSPTATLSSFPLPSYETPQVELQNNGTGAVVGRLIYNDNSSPGADLTVYIGFRETLQTGSGYVVTVQENSTPKSVTTPNGYFMITNLEPNIYSLVLWTPLGSKVLADPLTNEEYSVEIKANEITDMGDIPFIFP